MGLSIHFDGAADGEGGTFDLSSAGAWAAFGRWADSLPAAAYPLVRALSDDGAAKPTYLLVEQLSAALEAVPPPAGVKAVARRILEVTDVGEPDETAVIVGVGGEEDGDGPDAKAE